MSRYSLPPEEALLAAGADPVLLPRLLAHRAAVLEEGIPFRLLSVRRSSAYQAHLHADAERRLAAWERDGRVGPRPRPAAPPGRSKHELGMAYDFTGPRNDAEWTRAGELAEELGLESGHRYDDPGHVELEEPLEHLRTLQRLRVAGAAAAAAAAWLVADSVRGS